MYELFILGELMNQPLHGYRLQSILSNVVGPIRQISWGVLYPLIRKLENEGLIEKATEETGGAGRPRKVYRITDAGRDRFHWLMTEPAEYTTDFENLFDIKLSNFHYMETEEQVHIMKQYEDYLRFLEHHFGVLKKEVVANDRIPKEEKPYILRVFSHREHVLQADLAWIKQEIRETLGGINDD